MLKLLYYAAQGGALVVIAFFFLAALSGGPATQNSWAHRAVVLVCGCGALLLLFWALRAGHFQGRWIAGSLLAIAGVVFYFVALPLGLLLFTRVHWQ